MRRLFCMLLATLMIALPSLGQEKTVAKPTLAGNWEGALMVGAIKLRMAFKIAAKPDGGFDGTVISVDQSEKEIKIDDATLTDAKVVITIKLTKATFEGKLNDQGSEITGEWKQSGVVLPLTLKRVARITALNRPQEPKRPFPYREEDVAIANSTASVSLAGTLTLPKGNGPFPAAILISGSGPQDRDESLLSHKPFLVLSDYLTRHGIAVLRYDDRGTGKSTGTFATSTSADFATDAESALAFLKTRKEIDPKKIGLIGHSEGGLIAPMIAAHSKDVAFVVMLAGPGLSGETILILQGQAILKAMGATPEQLEKQKNLQTRIFKLVAEEKDNAVVEKGLKELFEGELAKASEAERKAAGPNAANLGMAQAKQVMTPWFRFFLPYDPAPNLKATKCPVLSLIGGKDLQVPAVDNNPVIEKTLKEGGNKDFTVKELPGLNHLFQTCKTGAVTEYGEIEETFNPAAMELIGDWIMKRMK